MFSAAATVLTAPVWFLSGTISAVGCCFCSSQLSLMKPLGSCPLYQHHATPLCWHQTAKTEQAVPADATLRGLVHIFPYICTYSVHMHTPVRTFRVPPISGLDPISFSKLSADSGSSVTSFIFQARTTSRPWEAHGAEVSSGGGSVDMSVIM